MVRGGRIYGTGDRTVSPSATRLWAGAISLALHLLAGGLLGAALDARPAPAPRQQHALTVIALETRSAPAAPPAAPQTDIPAARHGQAPPPVEPPVGPPVIGIYPTPAGGGALPPSVTEPPREGPGERPVAPRPAAPPPAARPTPDAARRDFLAAVWRRIDANRPRGTTMTGTTLVRFQLSADGTLLSATVARTSGTMLLDKIALRSVRLAAPFPPPPGGLDGDDLTFEIPIQFG